MSHPQAYHTSCRSGLAGHSGFQFNAATPGLDSTILAALAAAHAGYHVPRDYPLEPTPSEAALFPIALKHRDVNGIPVVSRTVYVGREFRGRDGEPDSGRFGNYFSHIVLGDQGAGEPFDGLLPIELWKAPHWQTEEAIRKELPELRTLSPGGCDLNWALTTLGGSCEAWLGPVLHAVLEAIDGGPRVVIVDAERERAAAWIAWVSYALPADLALGLSFSTFSGQPRYAQDVKVCVTTPGCDLAFAEHELGREVALLSPCAVDAPETRSLYPRILASLAGEMSGGEAVAERPAVTADTPRRMGAELAVLSGKASLASTEETTSVLEVIKRMSVVGRWDQALAAADALPSRAEEPDTLRGWWDVFEAARSSTPEPARALVDSALKRLVAAMDRLPDDLPELAGDLPTSPSPGALASWLELIERSGPAAEHAMLIAGGVRLGLIGCNVALDRRVAQAIWREIDDLQMTAVFDCLAEDQRHAKLVEEVLSGLAGAAFADETKLPLLRRALGHPALCNAAASFAARASSFDERSVWERLRVEIEPSSLHLALSALMQIAGDERRASEVKHLFGPAGPVEVEDHLMLLGAYREWGLTAAEDDVEAALGLLAGRSFEEIAQCRRLVEVLTKTAVREDLKRAGVFLAWWAAIVEPPQMDFGAWSAQVYKAVCAREHELPDALYFDLSDLAGRAAARGLSFHGARRARRGTAEINPKEDYTAGMTWLARAFEDNWPAAASLGLEHEVSENPDTANLIINAFLAWRELPPDTGSLLETALPQGLARLSPRRLQAVERLLGEREREDWLDWLETHPPKAGVTGTVSRLMRRGSRAQ